MGVIKDLALVVGIPALYCGLFFLGGAFSGAGHGSFYFAGIIMAPFSGFESFARIYLWLLVSILLALRRFTACRMTAAAVLVLHYSGVVVLSLKTDWDSVGRVWHAFPMPILVILAAYFISQIFMWCLIIRRPSESDVVAS